MQVALLGAAMADAEEHLQEAYTLHRSGNYKKGMKEAQKARKRFLKEGLPGRAVEALRVMADCALNAHDFREAKRLYKELLAEAREIPSPSLQAAAEWGLGEVSRYNMEYDIAAAHHETGLKLAQKTGDKWFTAWNAFGLGKSLRGLGRLEEAREMLLMARRLFEELSLGEYVGWVDRMLTEIGGHVESKVPGEMKVWLCPQCGSKYSDSMVEKLRQGRAVTCEYCGTTVG
ncbi:MAG: hypothetical protein DRO73_05510 [Candidatus Thorarchaeota archaeon]|nr:MAG: hypothetical protein DRO73_05510 [Candidatus Thorarchaeota archaeon]